VLIRSATDEDHDAIWAIFEPVIRAGETYTQPRDAPREVGLAYWFAPGNDVFVAEDPPGTIAGTYYMRANRSGAGAHVANCGYLVARGVEGRGVGRALCEDSLRRASARGFRAMQFNFVVSSNERAVRLWQSCGFQVVGRVPGAFDHPSLGFVDALIMFQTL
jgi:L-amino acid N-acyltransferase YncA